MSKILWITDPHLNFLYGRGGAKAFGDLVKEENPDADGAVITGDIAEFDNFDKLIENFADGFGKPVWFVLGNHDCYNGSIAAARKNAARLKKLARYLPSEQLVQLAEGVALVGHDGWYDARFGDPKRSQVVLNDFIYIKELKFSRGEALFWKLREIADAGAVEARGLIEAAIDAGNKKIVFATHVPPFAQAAWHEGQMSDKHWLPWMSSRAMGETLNELAGTHPDVEFMVLCGHTHSSGTYQHCANLVVHTGHSAYRYPRVCGVFDF